METSIQNRELQAKKDGFGNVADAAARPIATGGAFEQSLWGIPRAPHRERSDPVKPGVQRAYRAFLPGALLIPKIYLRFVLSSHMAKLRIGEILIEDSQIRIGGTQLVESAVESSSRLDAPASAAPLFWLRDARVPTQALGWAGAALITAGFITSLAARAWDDPIGALVRGGFMMPIGAGLLAAAFLRARLRAGVLDLNRFALGPSGDQIIDRLSSVLERGGRHQTVEWLTRRTGLRDVEVIRGLAVLRDRGALLEELDPDSGEFYYHPTRRTPQDLDSRLANIDQVRHM